jgi:hypothetical protein
MFRTDLFSSVIASLRPPEADPPLAESNLTFTKRDCHVLALVFLNDWASTALASNIEFNESQASPFWGSSQ